MGDTAQFNKQIQDQLTADLAEARVEYCNAVKIEKEAKEAYKRRMALRSIPAAQHNAADKKLLEKTVAKHKQRWNRKRQDRKAARKEYEEAHKSFEAFKDDEQKGLVRDNDIQKHGSQYRTKWTHLPE